jgi:hypothetical protein
MQHASACDAPILCRAQVGDQRAAAFDARAAAVAEAAGVLAGVRLTASAWVRAGVAVCEDGARTSAAQLLARPQMSLGAVRAWRRCRRVSHLWALYWLVFGRCLLGRGCST